MNLDTTVPKVFIRFTQVFGLYRGKRITGFILRGMVLLLALPLSSPVRAALPGVEVHKDIPCLKDDAPVPADYAGSGFDSIGIFRASSGLWVVGDVTRVYFDGSGDMFVTR
jgi:hypothetical protein